jgi:hypothetical protein
MGRMTTQTLPHPATGLARAWQVWLAANLADRVAPSALIEVLVNEAGLDRDAAGRHVTAYLSAPGVEAARTAADRLHKLESLLEVRHSLARLAPDAGEVPRVREFDRTSFLIDHYSRNVPALAERWAADWPALQRCTPHALAERYGSERVEVMAGRDADPAYEVNHRDHRHEVSLHEYVTWCLNGPSNDAYLVANNRLLDRPSMQPALADLAPLPDILDTRRTRGNAFLWLGPEGTITPLHHDVDNVLFVQLYGRKRVTLVDPMQSHRVYNTVYVYSDVDAGNPDLDRHPRFADVDLMSVTVEPGDVLFIPVGWWHRVESLSVSVSASFVNFAYPNSFDWQLFG